MKSLNSKLTNWMPEALGVLRIMSALLFLEHATQKLFAFPVPAPPNRFSPPALETFEGWLELVG
jgi:putative oxidoreductase